MGPWDELAEMLAERLRAGSSTAREGAELARRLVDGIRAAWPEIEPEPASFARYIADRVSGEPDPDEALRQLRGPDLYLAWACSRGVPAAVAELERRYLAPLPRVLAGAGYRPEIADEAAQRVREHLLVAVPDSPPRIGLYSGRGALASWVRVVAVRIALKSARGRAPEVPLENALPRAAAGADPEAAYIKQRSCEEVEAAFRAAVAALRPEDRATLRLYFAEGLTVEQIAGLHGVAKSTASRWLSAARQALEAATRRVLRDRLGLGDSEVGSLVAAAQSRLELSLRELLAP